MDIYQFQDTEPQVTMPELLRQHILAKHEHEHGVIIIEQDGRYCRTHGANTKDILEKSLAYYSTLPNTKIRWCKTVDIAKSLEKIL